MSLGRITLMANTYTQLYIHIVFTVKNRQNLIKPEHREELQMYISGIVKNQRHKLLAISCMPDHTHVFIGLRPDGSISDLVREIKASSSAFINSSRWTRIHFHWQEGFGAFSHSHSAMKTVIHYILNQEAHHKRETFQKECLRMLKQYEIDYS